MNIAVLAIVGLVLLTGLFTLAFGHRGWNWGTVAAAILALLASGGYVYLAARIAERERAWTKVVTKYEADVLRARDAVTAGGTAAPTPIAGEKSLAALANEKARWQRALDLVDTWRGRSWKQASFVPPRDGAAGSITLPEQAAEGGAGDGAAAPEPPLAVNAGAELSVFDESPLKEGGRFLGVFRVTESAFDAATKRNTLKIVAAAAADAKDLDLWAKPHDVVTVYEDLPVDRWAAFHRMPSQADAPADDAVLPVPAKTDPKELLEHLERQYASFEQHGQEVEGDPEEIAARFASGEAAPGRYWAVVEFEAPHELDEKIVEQIKERLQPDIDDEDKVKSTFETGETAEFDLQTAIDLKGKLKILKVIDRRPLSDAFTRLLGGAVLGGGNDAALRVRADGIASLRRVLQAEIRALEESNARLASTEKNVRSQFDRFDEERSDLQEDLKAWRLDVAAAGEMAAAFEGRLGAVSDRLAATVKEIGDLGRTLVRDSGRLAAEIDREAPPPVRGGALLPPARR